MPRAIDSKEFGPDCRNSNATSPTLRLRVNSNGKHNGRQGRAIIGGHFSPSGVTRQSDAANLPVSASSERAEGHGLLVCYSKQTMRRLGEACHLAESWRPFMIAVLLLSMVGCSKEATEEETAQRLGDVDIKLPQVGPTFGYLKERLSPLAFSEEDCGGSGVKYIDCKHVYWSQQYAPLVDARFITGQSQGTTLGGSPMAYSVRDDHRVYDIVINRHFRGTLCGDRIQKVINSKMACGMGVEALTDNSGTWGIKWPIVTTYDPH